VLGVCLGGQLVAHAAGAWVGRASEPEIGWHQVELTAAAHEDPVLGGLPERFDTFQWHFYTYELPAGACELAESAVCSQGFRLGERAWGIQFHAEVTRAQIEEWVEIDHRELLGPGDDLLRETEERIEAWTAIGRELCGAFLEAAERVAAAA
jgi:GMP synthase (glutamine-hydrolysing)